MNTPKPNGRRVMTPLGPGYLNYIRNGDGVTVGYPGDF